MTGSTGSGVDTQQNSDADLSSLQSDFAKLSADEVKPSLLDTKTGSDEKEGPIVANTQDFVKESSVLAEVIPNALAGKPEVVEAEINSSKQEVADAETKMKNEQVEAENDSSKQEPVEAETNSSNEEPVEADTNSSKQEPVEAETNSSNEEPVEADTNSSKQEPVEAETISSNEEPVEADTNNRIQKVVNQEVVESKANNGKQEPVEAETIGSKQEVGEADTPNTIAEDGTTNAEPELQDVVTSAGAESETNNVISVEDSGQQAEDIGLIMNAAALLQKLDISESSDGGSNGDDDVGSSVDSTANSGPPQVEGEVQSREDKVVSSEDCADEASLRRKKRIDLGHQFVRGIVKIQHDRDQYEKQCQNKKQEDAKDQDVSKDEKPTVDSRARRLARRSSAQGIRQNLPARSTGYQRQNDGHKRLFLEPTGLLSSRADLQPRISQVRPHTTPINQDGSQQLGSSDKVKQQRFTTIYRPPNLRNTDAEALQENETSHQIATSNPIRNNFLKEGPSASAASLHYGRPKSAAQATTKEFSEDLEQPEALSANMAIKVTFDTERQKRHIQLSKPSKGDDKGDNNFIVTFDTTKKERHIAIPTPITVRGTEKEVISEHETWRRNNTGEGKEHKTFKFKESNDLPASFEFKATAFGKTFNDISSAENALDRKTLRGRNKFRSPRAVGNLPLFEAGSTPRCESDRPVNGALDKQGPQQDGRSFDAVEQLPPKDEPFAGENSARIGKWCDIVEESEAELSPNFILGNAGTKSNTPDVLESNQWHKTTPSPRDRINSRRKQKQKPKKKEWGNTPAHQQSENPPLEVSDSQNKEAHGRKSVWERLGPRPSEENSRFRTVHYEPRTESKTGYMREVTERDYFCKDETGLGPLYCETVQAAFKDPKQKRTRLELYVPRRGSQLS